jgi:alpha-galactosidase
MRKISPKILFLAAAALGWIGCRSSTTEFTKIHGREAEMAAAGRWAAVLGEEREAKKTSAYAPSATDPLGSVFSFTYGSRPSAALIPQWKQASHSSVAQDWRLEMTKTYTDPAAGLEVRVESTVFRDYPAVEWVLHFKNTGRSDSPILENIHPLAAELPLAGRPDPPVVHYAKGALCSIDDFAPIDKTIDPDARLSLQPGGGRPSSEVLPFFNLDFGAEGMILGIGWTGEWAASFSRDARRLLRVESGLAKTRLILHPGEEIRTPRILALFWQGEPVRGNNLLRRFLLTHHRPRPGGRPIVLPVLLTAWGGSPAVDHFKMIQRIIKRQLPIDLYWIDAEWFGADPWWKNNGNWAVRRELYPRGFRAVSDPLHRSGRKFLLWFEPQRVCRNSEWARFKDRPGWLLELGDGTPEYKQHNMDWKVPHEDARWVLWESRRSQIHEDDMLWNMGEPEARRFLTDWLSARIDEFGLDWYREDFNIAPLEFWQHADPPDRQGMTEIRYIEGLYAMWDELLQRHPGLAIDNCASGGRRIDLETIGRSTALWRTDWPADAIHRQCHTFGLLSWVPLNMSEGAVLVKGSEYEWRSAMSAGLNVKLPDPDDEESARLAAGAIEQYLSIRRFFYGDYYPLTKYSQAGDVWMAYQLDLPEAGEGLIVALKRPGSKQVRGTLRLKGLDGAAVYQITNLDSRQSQTLPGSRLLGEGLEVELSKQPDSALIRYSRTAK